MTYFDATLEKSRTSHHFSTSFSLAVICLMALEEEDNHGKQKRRNT